MIVTCDPNSRDFWPLIFKQCPKVLLNGSEIERVRAADDERGWVETYAEGPIGVSICECRNRAIVKLVFGHVEIVGPLRPVRIGAAA